MMGWIFSGITLSAVLVATFARHIRHAVLALWVAGLAVGGVYLVLGAEVLAIIQWIISTLVTISFIFFSVVFGEYNAPAPRWVDKKILFPFLSVFLGAAFTGVIWLGAKEIPEIFPEPTQGTTVGSATVGTDLETVGRMITQENLLSLEVLALTLFLVLVGGGVIARLEGGSHS